MLPVSYGFIQLQQISISHKDLFSSLQVREKMSSIMRTPMDIQALTTFEIFRFPIGQPAGKNQVAPIKIQDAPFCGAS